MVVPPPPGASKTRKHLSADALYALVRKGFDRIPDHRGPDATIALSDALMSAFALFALKDPSLLAFDGRRNDANMKMLFGIEQIPCDTRMREILDEVGPERLRRSFADVFAQLQRGKDLKRFAFYSNCYLLALDGTGYFSSQKVHCPSCMEKAHKNGAVTYEHHLLGAALVHPDFREVVPLAPEPIQKQDGSNKNDCERNAARRILQKIRQEHPHLKLIVVEDGLASNGPHIRDLIQYGMHFILGVQPGDHTFLFAQVKEARRKGASPRLTQKLKDGVAEVSFVDSVPLNESHQDLRVNFLEYTEYDKDGNCRKHFTWITDLPITLRNVWRLVEGGRARWSIENETFNTLKNQGYHFEHNFGHGKKNLSVVFAMLMMLAFLVDQAQQIACPLFRATWKKLGSKRTPWENLRSHFYHFRFRSMRDLYHAILYDLCKEVAPPGFDTS